MHVLLLHDDIRNDTTLDQQDTLDTAYTIQKTLESFGWHTMLVPWRDDLWQDAALFKAQKNTLLFNLLESINGDCRLNYQAAQLAEQMQVAYTGGNSLNLWLTTDKILTKQVLQAFNLPTAPWLVWDDYNLEAIQQFLQQHEAIIIKPVCEDSSVGIDEHCYIRTPQDIEYFLRHKQTSITRWFAEKFIDGREFHISALNLQGKVTILPIPELQFSDAYQKPKIIDYAGKWLTDSYEYTQLMRNFDLPQSDPLLQKLHMLAHDSWRLLQLTGFARFDVRVDSDNNPWILEVNVNPALDPQAGFAAAADRAGINYTDLLKTIVDEACHRYQSSDKLKS